MVASTSQARATNCEMFTGLKQSQHGRQLPYRYGRVKDPLPCRGLDVRCGELRLQK